MTSNTTSADGNEFANNLFSDLAPLLTLFGERFAQQFLSESTYLDHIVFAMAPLGIVTAIVCAIRISGPQWLKALVGRARENIAAIEIDVMSSTSHEVCELFNGQAVIRSLGKPKLAQIVYHDSKKKETLPRDGPRLTVLGEKDGNMRATNPQVPFAKLFRPKIQHHDSEKGKSDSKPVANEPPQLVSDEAPNISLNLHNGNKDFELALYAMFGILLQSGVLVFSAFTAYHPYWSSKLGGLKSSAGFPLLATGTVCLVTSMALCSLIVERKTVEKEWRPESKTDAHILWLQTAAVVGEQSFDSFLLTTEMPHPDGVVRTSRRRPNQNSKFRTTPRRQPSQQTNGNTSQISDQNPPHNSAGHLSPHSAESLSEKFSEKVSNIVTLFAVVLGLFGFVAQFQGFRLSNWSNSVAQLVAVFLMTCLRALARRGLVNKPRGLKLPKGHELDWLAFNLALKTKLSVAGQGISHETQGETLR